MVSCFANRKWYNITHIIRAFNSNTISCSSGKYNNYSEIPLTLLSVGISVMFNGFARIMQGTFDRSQPTWFRAFSVGIGALSIGMSIYVTNSKMFGIIFPIRALFIVLLIYGISMIIYGVTRKLSLDKILKKKVNSTDG
jgi:uncharacterized membrane protein HdeD (DUF308 family)